MVALRNSDFTLYNLQRNRNLYWRK